jgi:hypothetical protein
VYVSYYFDGCLELEESGLIKEDLFGSGAYCSDLCVSESDVLVRCFVEECLYDG